MMKMSSKSKRKAWEKAFANVKLEYPDWQPDEEYFKLIEYIIQNDITIEHAIYLLTNKYKVEDN